MPKTKSKKPEGLGGGKGVGIGGSVLELQKGMVGSQLSPAVLSQFNAIAGKAGKKSSTFFGTSTYKQVKELLTSYIAKQGSKSGAWRRGQVGTLDGLLESWFSKEKNTKDKSEVGKAKMAAMQFLRPKVQAEQSSLNGTKTEEKAPEEAPTDAPSEAPTQEQPGWQRGTKSGGGGGGPIIGGGRGKQAPKEAPKPEPQSGGYTTSGGYSNGGYGSNTIELEDEDEVVDKVVDEVEDQIEQPQSLTGGKSYGSSLAGGKSYGGSLTGGKSYSGGKTYSTSWSPKDDDDSSSNVIDLSASSDSQEEKDKNKQDSSSSSIALSSDSVLDDAEEPFEQKKIIGGAKWERVSEVLPSYHGEHERGSVVLKAIYDDILTVGKYYAKDGKRRWAHVKDGVEGFQPLQDDDERADYMREGWKWNRSTFDHYFKLMLETFGKKESDKSKQAMAKVQQEPNVEVEDEDEVDDDDEDDSEILNEDDDLDSGEEVDDEVIKAAYGGTAGYGAYGAKTKGSYGTKVQYESGVDDKDDPNKSESLSSDTIEEEPEQKDDKKKKKPKDTSHEQTSILVKAKKKEEDRKKYKLKLGGTIMRGDEDKAFDTSDMMTNKSGAGYGIFVMAPSGDIYAGTHKVGIFHHSSFLGGGQTAGAGELMVTGGKLKHLTNKSGHYIPNDWDNMQVIEELKDQGVAPNTYAFTNFGANESMQEFTSAQSYLNQINYKGIKRR